MYHYNFVYDNFSGDNYGTVISKIQVTNNTDPTLIPLWKTNKSGVNSDDGKLYGYMW